MKRLDLVRDVLDKQVVDVEKTRMGRVDGLLLELRPGQPPRVKALEMGSVTLAGRVGPRTTRLVEALRRFSVRRTARFQVPWEKVLDVDREHLRVDLDQKETPAFDWERWLRRHFVRKVPGEKE